MGWYIIPEYFERTVEAFPQNVALKAIRDGKWMEITYADMHRLVHATASYLKEKGAGKGWNIGILAENSPEWIIAFFAISYTGATAVPIDSRLSPAEYRHIIKEADINLLFTSPRYREELEELSSSMKRKLELILLPAIHSLPERKAPFPDVNLEDEAVLMFSSGTTGVSKGIVLLHRNFAANLDAFYQTFDFRDGEAFYLLLPLHHSFPITTSMLAPISVGATIVVARSFRPNEIREEMVQTQPHHMMIVPLFLEKMVRSIEKKVESLPPVKRTFFLALKGASKVVGSRKAFAKVREQMGFGRMRHLVSGGAALPSWVAEALEGMGFPILQGYGLAETAPVVSVNPLSAPRNRSVGFPLPYVEVKIVDPGEDGVGEIAVRGPNVMKGYFKDPERTREVFTSDRFFLTGDMGYFDSDGYLYVSGRKKYVIVTRGGKNIYPEEIENALLRSEFIQEVLVLAGRHPETGADELHALVYPNFDALYEYFEKKGIEVNEKNIYNFIGEQIKKYSQDLADYKRVKRFAIRQEEFPKTTSQKVKRYLFQEEFKTLK